MVRCAYFISQMLNNELWTCCMADRVFSRTDIVPIKL